MFPYNLSALLCVIGVHSSFAFLFTAYRCGESPKIAHASIHYDNDVNDVDGYNVTYVCNDGFHIAGPSDTIECACTGHFTCHLRGAIPSCKRDPVCINLPSPPHGHVRYEGHVVAHYSCNKGFVLIGPKTRHCEGTGQWSGGEPKCETVPKPSALRCRACDRVKHLDQCNRIITCQAGEECFTEHIVNNVTRLSVFTSGCRPKQDCSLPSNTSGHDVVMCSECCADLNAPLGCNSELCSFREHSGGNSTYCLQCDLENSIKDCNTITACDHTQMCVSSTIIEGEDHKVTAGCYSSTTCLSLIKTLIQSTDSRDVTLTDKRDIVHLCDMCCGDDGCNSDTCEHVKERMAYLYQQGELDLETLKWNGTLILTTKPTSSSAAASGSSSVQPTNSASMAALTSGLISSSTASFITPSLPPIRISKPSQASAAVGSSSTVSTRATSLSGGVTLTPPGP